MAANNSTQRRRDVQSLGLQVRRHQASLGATWDATLLCITQPWHLSPALCQLSGARIITGVLNFCAGSSGPHLSLQVSWLQRPSLWPASSAPLHLLASLQTWLCYASLQTLPSPVSCCHSRRPAQHGCSALIFLSASVTGLGCQGTATVALTVMLNQPHVILV